MGRAQKLKQQRKEEEAKRQRQERKKIWKTTAIVTASILTVAVTIGLILLVNELKKEEEAEAGKPKITQELVLETSKGEIVVGLYGEDAPISVMHMTDLVEQGYYDGLRWYRVEDFVVQTGSHYQSLVAESEGAEPDQAQLEQALADDQAIGAVMDEVKLPLVRGAISFAKQSDMQTGTYTPNSGRTDFFILKSDRTDLNNDFTAFGEVVQGMDVVDSLEDTDVLITATIREK